MPNIGMQELLVIFAILVLLFGGKKLAEFGKGMGEGIRSFKKGIREAKDIDKDLNSDG